MTEPMSAPDLDFSKPHVYRQWIDSEDVGNTCCLEPRNARIHSPNEVGPHKRSRHLFTPGPRYYIWLRWLTFSSKRVSPPDPKPWQRYSAQSPSYDDVKHDLDVAMAEVERLRSALTRIDKMRASRDAPLWIVTHIADIAAAALAHPVEGGESVAEPQCVCGLPRHHNGGCRVLGFD